MILVAGGTGRLGSTLVAGLQREHARVRVFTRSSAAAERLRSDGIDVVVGDVRQAADAARAVAGCATVISAISGFGPMGTSTPENVDRDGNVNLIQAAVEAGAEHFVLVSMRGAKAEAGLPILRMKFAAEQALCSSGLGWTIIRPTVCLETYLDAVGQALAKNGSTMVMGSGLVPINFVSVTDVVALIVHTVHDPAFRGQLIEWGGPNLTLRDLSDALHASEGVAGKTNRIPLPMLRLMSVAAKPFSPFFARVAQAAVALNTTDMTFDAASTRRGLPDLPWTSLVDAIEARQQRSAHARGL